MMTTRNILLFNVDPPSQYNIIYRYYNTLSCSILNIFGIQLQVD